MRTKLFIGFSILFSLFIFYPFLTTFFVQDDFFFLVVSRAFTFNDIISFFIPLKDVVWYRPLSSQVFFFVGSAFFGLHPEGFHLIVFVTHVLTGFFLYKLTRELFKNKKTALFASLIYLTNASNAIAISWLSAYSFILGPFFLILLLLAYIRKRTVLSIILFLFGVLSTEIFILSLVPIFVFEYFHGNKKFTKLAPFIIISIGVVVIRYLVKTTETSTLYSISYSAVIPLFQFYLFRFFGLPLLIKNLIDETMMQFMLIYFSGFLFILILSFVKTKQLLHKLIVPFFIFTVFLLPFLLLPNHQAPYYISFSLIGFSMILGCLLSNLLSTKLNSILFYLSVIFYLSIQSISIYYTYTTHWIIRRAVVSEYLINKGIYFAPIETEEYYSLGANMAEKLYTLYE